MALEADPWAKLQPGETGLPHSGTRPGDHAGQEDLMGMRLESAGGCVC